MEQLSRELAVKQAAMEEDMLGRETRLGQKEAELQAARVRGRYRRLAQSQPPLSLQLTLRPGTHQRPCASLTH